MPDRGRGVRPRAPQCHREIVVIGTVQVAHLIAVHRRGGVEIVHHEIERAVVIEIDVGRAVRESRGVESPGGGQVGEREIPVVVKRVIRPWHVRHLRNESSDRRLNAGWDRVERRDVVEIVRPAVDAGGDEQVLAPIVVEVGKERRPAPVGRGDAGEQPDLAEAELAANDAAVQLQRVARVLVVVARREL